MDEQDKMPTLITVLTIRQAGYYEYARVFSSPQSAADSLQKYLRKVFLYDGPADLTKIDSWLQTELDMQLEVRTLDKLTEPLSELLAFHCPLCGAATRYLIDRDQKHWKTCMSCSWHKEVNPNPEVVRS